MRAQQFDNVTFAKLQRKKIETHDSFGSSMGYHRTEPNRTEMVDSRERITYLMRLSI